MIIVLIGTKAQLVKMAPILNELTTRNMPFRFVLTGQHKETMTDLIDAFKLRAADDVLVDLGESDTKLKLFKWFYRANKAINKNKQMYANASMILVHGDTLSTLFGALVGKRFGVSVCHIEAGLRSYNYFNPFPEEIIRILTSYLTSVHFCSSEWAAKNLEKFSNKSKIINTHENTILDSLRFAIRNTLKADSVENYGVFSVHRNENLSDANRYSMIMNILNHVSENILIKFVLHPVTKNKIIKTGWYDKLSNNMNIQLCDRMDYVSFTNLLVNSRFLITDGGSNQEESYLMGLPCLLLRKKTERMEGLSDNVIISNYDQVIIDMFVEKNINIKWQQKKLPEVYPSKLIIDHISSMLY